MSALPFYVNVELRVDPADGHAYDFQSFLNFYGPLDGLVRWMGSMPLAAPVAPAALAPPVPPAPPAAPAAPAPPVPPAPPASLVAHVGLLDAITKSVTKIVQEKAAQDLAKKVKIEAEVQRLEKDIEIADSQLKMSQEKSVILKNVTEVVEKEKDDISEYLDKQEEKQDALKDQLKDPRQLAREARKRAREEQGQQVDTGGAAETESILWQFGMKIARTFTTSKK
jgi:hypothetical protein